MFHAIKQAIYRWKTAHPKLGISMSRLRPLKKSAIRGRLRDIRNLNHALRPHQAARIDAVNGDPDLSSGAPGNFETRARAVTLNEIDRLQAETRSDLQAVDTRIKRLPLVPAIEAKALMAMATERQESVLRSWAAGLADMKRVLLRAYRALTAFRRDNSPVQARSVRSHDPTFVIPGILAVTAVEMWINAQLLLDSGGHTGTEIASLVVFTSLVNMSLGLMIGFFGARNMGHVRGDRKLAGFGVVLAGAGLVVGLAYWMAMYRNAIESALDDPAAFTNAALRLQRMAAAKAAIRQTMQNDTFAFLGHLHAIMIFVLGLLFGTIAAFEGYHLLDDPYPGYGAADRLYRNARDVYERELALCQADFASLLEEIATHLDAVLSRAGQRLTGIKTCLDAAAGIIERYEKSAAAVEQDFIGALIDYQKEYVLVRGTQGPARWQEELPLLNRPSSFDVGTFVETEERAVADLQGFEDRVARLKTELAKSQAEAVSRLKVYLQTVDIDQPNEEEIALNNLFGLRMPSPPDAHRGYTGGGEGPAAAF